VNFQVRIWGGSPTILRSPWFSSVHQRKFGYSTLKLTTTTSTYFPIHYSLFIHAVIRQYFFPRSMTAPSGPVPPHCRGFKITPRHTTFSRTPLDEWSPRHGDDLTTQHSQDTPIPPGGIRNRNPSKRTTEEPRLSPSGHWDRHSTVHVTYTKNKKFNNLAITTWSRGN